MTNTILSSLYYLYIYMYIKRQLGYRRLSQKAWIYSNKDFRGMDIDGDLSMHR